MKRSHFTEIFTASILIEFFIFFSLLVLKVELSYSAPLFRLEGAHPAAQGMIQRLNARSRAARDTIPRLRSNLVEFPASQLLKNPFNYRPGEIDKKDILDPVYWDQRTFPRIERDSAGTGRRQSA